MKMLNLAKFKELVIQGSEVRITDVATMDLSDVPDGYVPYITGEPLRQLLSELVIEQVGGLAAERLVRLGRLRGQESSFSAVVEAIVEPLLERLSGSEARVLRLAFVAINRYRIDLPQSMWWTDYAQRVLNEHFPLSQQDGYRFACRDLNILLYKHVAQSVYVSTLPLQGAHLANTSQVLFALTRALLSIQRRGIEGAR